MLRQTINLFLAVFLVVTNSLAAVRTEEDKLIEELSGISKKAATVKPVKAAITAVTTLSEKHLFAGLEAFKKKNYILALKHYNTVIIKHSHSKDVKSAFIAKSRLYAEMGLLEQSQQNLQKALQLDQKLTR